MKKLSDTHTILLSSASQRDGGSLLPLPTTLTNVAAASKAVAALIASGLAEEREASGTEGFYREDGNARYGVFITANGLKAIGLNTIAGGETEQPAATVPVGRVSKAASIVALLERVDGATMADLITATGWLPHTTRAALTGLRKKGHVITRGKRDGTTFYSISVGA